MDNKKSVTHQPRYRILMYILCIMILLLSLNSLSIFANETASITVGRMSAEPGQRVTIPVTLESNPGIAFIRVNVEYDATRLRIDSVDSVTRGTALSRLTFTGVDASTYRHNPFVIVRHGTANDTSTGILVNIEFTVLETAPAGDAVVSVIVGDREAFNRDTVPVSVAVIQGGISVLGEEPAINVQPTPSPTPVPTPTPDATPSPSPTPETTPPPPPESLPLPSPSPEPNATPPSPSTPATPVSPAHRIPTDWQVITPRTVYVPALPLAIQDVAEDNFVFTAEISESNYNESVRVLMSVPYERAEDVMLESIVAYHVDAYGATQLIISSLYDEAQSIIRLIGYTGELYMVTSNHFSFADVPTEQWYYRAVTFVAARELFSGIGNNLFAPSSTMTRGMFVTVLSRLDGADVSQFDESPFFDVDINNWYGQAIAWAAMDGILDGGILPVDSHDTFQPYAYITREDMAVIFANYLSTRDFPLVELDVPLFYDLDHASPWARDAIQSMRTHSIISGVGGNLYNPQGEATRAEVAQIFTNLVRAIVGLS